MKVLFLSRYSNLGASSRLRAFQYLPYLASQGMEVSVSPLVGDDYIKNLYEKKDMKWDKIIVDYAKRLATLLKCRQYNLIWIEKELFPYLPALGEILLNLLKTPYIVDYDDATYHNYDLSNNPFVRMFFNKKIATIMRRAAGVIVGNDYLAAYARQAGVKRIGIIPTAIDLDRYVIKPYPSNDVFTVGWIGSPSTSKFLFHIQSALSKICRDSKTQLSVIGSDSVTVEDIPTRMRTWTEATEVQEIQEFDVGIMPLPDKPWERGKCGYKLIQYMACSRPVVASPVGINKTIVDNGINGFLADSTDDWIKALNILRDNRDLRIRMGNAGRKSVEEKYCIQKTAPQLAAFLWSVHKENS